MLRVVAARSDQELKAVQYSQPPEGTLSGGVIKGTTVKSVLVAERLNSILKICSEVVGLVFGVGSCMFWLRWPRKIMP